MSRRTETNVSGWDVDHLKECLQPLSNNTAYYEIVATINWMGLLPLCVFGTLLNVIALGLLNRPPRITSGVVVFLNALLCLDILQLLTTSTQLIPHGCDYAYNKTRLGDRFCTFYYRYLNLVTPRVVATVDTMHMWTITALSIHRCWKVSRPVTARINDTIPRAVAITVGIIVAAAVFRIPMFCELHILRNSRIVRIDTNQRMAENFMYNAVYYLFANGLLYHILPFACMATFSFITLRILRKPHIPKHYRRLSSLFRSSARVRREIRATLSITLMVLLYLLFHCLSIYEMAKRALVLLGQSCFTLSDSLLIEVSTLLAMFSSTMNAIIFIALTNRVKQSLEFYRRRSSASRTLSTSSCEPDRLSPKSVNTFFDNETVTKADTLL